VPLPPVAVPTLGMWSTGDEYLTEAAMVRSADHVAGPWRYERIEGATHWIPLDLVPPELAGVGEAMHVKRSLEALENL
jgi:hypothetical protein